MGIRDLGSNNYLELGRKLREIRRKAGLSQGRVGQEMGLKPPSCASYVYRLEHGKLTNVRFSTILRYLQACGTPVGRFMLELAQSGVFGEAEQGLVVVEDRTKIEGAKRAKAKLLYDKRWLREAEDAEIIRKLWTEVQAAIVPLFPSDPSLRLVTPYQQGVRTLYKAWKQAVRSTGGLDATLMVEMAFDRIEQLGIQKANMVPAAVRKLREIVFERLMAMTPTW
jgi:transcriptional regulator with XRE-family HTH domain